MLDTKARLLDAAERLFAARGFEGTSLRAVTREAGAGLSAANYHFGGKEAMIHAALLRRIGPVTRRRLELLDALESAASGSPIAVEMLVAAYIRPAFEVLQTGGDAGADLRALIGRLHSDPYDGMDALRAALFQPTAVRYLEAFGRALPERSEQDLACAFQCMVGMLVHGLIGRVRPGPDGSSPPGPSSREGALLARMIAFATAGFDASVRELPRLEGEVR